MTQSVAYDLIVFEWLVIHIGCFLIYHIIQYMKTKPIVSQTLLDWIRIDFFAHVIFELILIGIIGSDLIINDHSKNFHKHMDWLFDMVIGWGAYTARIIVSIQLLVGIVVKHILIFHPDFLEKYEETQIMTVCR